MAILSLVITDLLVPIFFGILTLLSINENINILNHLHLYFLFSLSLILISLLKNYYQDYFVTHFSEKLRISFITSSISIIIQILVYLYNDLTIGILVVLTWLAIPILILIIRYFITVTRYKEKEISIYIIGNFYNFNDFEISSLASKGFKIYFYDNFEKFLKNKKFKKLTHDSLILINYKEDALPDLGEYKEIFIKMKCIKLDEFMKKYLRKIFIYSKYPVTGVEPYSNIQYVTKRTLDYFSFILLFPLLIICCIFVLVVKVKNKIYEPFTYKQSRCGVDNKLFNLIKIRTMYAKSENHGNTSKNDDRIYPFARTVRKLRMDELPQIFNILFGDMHLIGPRAEWVKLSDEYIKNINNYELRYIVKPGITGWAQIAYRYGVDQNDAEQKLMYDLYYIKNWSIWLEIEICIKTVMVILDKKGF